MFLYVLFCTIYDIIKKNGWRNYQMYVSITGNKGNQDVYIKQSYRKDNGKTSSRIYKKLGKYNTLLEQFSGNEKELMDWAKKEAEKETLAYNQQKEKVLPFFVSSCSHSS